MTDERQDGDAQQDDPHPSQPMREAAPELQRIGKDFHVIQDRRARRRKARNRFKKGVGKAGEARREVKRQAAEQEYGQPNRYHKQQAFALSQLAFRARREGE